MSSLKITLNKITYLLKVFINFNLYIPFCHLNFYISSFIFSIIFSLIYFSRINGFFNQLCFHNYSYFTKLKKLLTFYISRTYYNSYCLKNLGNGITKLISLNLKPFFSVFLEFEYLDNIICW